MLTIRTVVSPQANRTRQKAIVTKTMAKMDQVNQPPTNLHDFLDGLEIQMDKGLDLDSVLHIFQFSVLVSRMLYTTWNVIDGNGAIV